MNAQTRSRVITASVGIPFLILVIGWGRSEYFTLLVFLITVAGLWEYFRIVFRDRLKERSLGMLLGVLVSLGLVIPGHPEPGLPLAIVILLAFSSHLFFGGKLEERYQRLGWTLIGTLYIGYFVPHTVLLYGSRDGRAWVFFVLLTIMSGDTAGYFVGRSWGKNKLCPEISPGKTVEGTIASLAGSVLAAVVGGQFLLPAIPRVESLLLSVVLSVLGQAGDLFESWIKRVFSVKDSGRLLPGHGGLLDRLDSLIFPVVFMTHYLRLFHP